MRINKVSISPKSRERIQLSVGKLYDFTDMHIPIEVVRGAQDGPVMFMSAALHGDEINGTEIIRRVLKKVSPAKLKGALIAVPVVNVFGFNTKSRYLPDRRDLNRSFPGSRRGSLASQMAYIFMKEVVSRCTHGIDFHTGAVHRDNLPQIRACLDDEETLNLAKSFGAPVLINSQLRDGSLREAARKKKIPVLLFEGGEALRFNESVIRAGVKGTLEVMKAIGMLSTRKAPVSARQTFLARDSYWVRASCSGSLHFNKKLGDHVEKGGLLAFIQDPFGEQKIDIRAEEGGIVIGMTHFPLVNRGDAVYHIATFNNLKKVSRYLQSSDYDR